MSEELSINQQIFEDYWHESYHILKRCYFWDHIQPTPESIQQLAQTFMIVEELAEIRRSLEEEK
jgi:hypothetical protein